MFTRVESVKKINALARWEKVWRDRCPRPCEKAPIGSFYAADGAEPPHVHVERDRAEAKYWLAPVRLTGSRRFSARELRIVERLVVEHEDRLLEAWNEYFND